MSGETDFLAAMARASEARSAAAAAAVPLRELVAAIRDVPAGPTLRLSAEGFDLIMELKLSSPANGVLAADSLDARAQVERYAAAGAAVVSVLTEPERFRGTLDHLTTAVAALRPHGIPVMRKDFLVDAYQLYEARRYGAGGVLLICRMLTPQRLRELVMLAADLGLFVLLETFDEADIAAAAAVARDWSGPARELLIGVNSRDLVTLKVVPERLLALAGHLPRAWPRVAESGLNDAADARRLAGAGYDLALVGTALMAAADPVRLGADMLSAGRDAIRARSAP